LQLTFLGSGTSAGVPMIGCDCSVCTSTDPKDRRTRPSVLLRWPDAGADIEPGQTSSWDEAKPTADLASGFHTEFNPQQRDHRQLLIDTAPELREQCLRHRLSRIDAVLYTHAHADHIFGLDDLRRFNAVMKRPIDLYAEQAVLDTFRGMFRYIFEPHTNVNPSFIPQLLAMPVLPPEENGSLLEMHGATIRPLRLMHGRLPILGFRIEHAGRSLAYCTDCSTIPPQTWPHLRDLDVLVIDALRYKHHPTHMTVDRALEVADELRPGRTILTHLAHDIGYAELADRLPDGIEPAYDGMAVEI
jgi:phosphoribosyl 1,2-cyclic phosphate phosphodiesterase